MHNTLLKSLNFLIKDLDSYDYIVTVKYVIYLICRILYEDKQKGLPYFNDNGINLFHEYETFDLKDIDTQKKLNKLIEEHASSLDLKDFRPAELYEALLTSKEKKILGQVYTPSHIIVKMLNQLSELKNIGKDTKILDPSCGGGYFLIEAFKLIKKHLNNHITDSYIIEYMLYGIDIDDFSVFLSKASLLFITDDNITNFNIYKLDYLTDSFDFGKFNIVVGNPPYVGHKNSSTEYKKILYDKYSDIFYDKADISYCFFKKSKLILKDDGVVSFITSRYFMEALYATKMREYLNDNYNIVSIVDYGGNRVFKDAMVSPAVITLSNNGGNKTDFLYVNISEESTEKFYYNQNKLKSSGWTILKGEDEQLYNRIDSISNTYIHDVCTIKQGIITGLDKAFIVDEKIIEKYQIESKLLKKWIKNSNISKSGIQYNNLYLIYSNIIDHEDNYPNAIKCLSAFKDRLQNRRECIRGYRKWYELQWSRSQSDFENSKIVFPYKSSSNNFYFDENQYFCSADVYLMNNFSNEINLEYFLSYLNSDIFEFYFKCQAKKVGNNLYEYYPNKLCNSKIFLPPSRNKQNISHLGKFSIENFLKKVFNISEEEVNIINKYINKG